MYAADINKIKNTTERSLDGWCSSETEDVQGLHFFLLNWGGSGPYYCH